MKKKSEILSFEFSILNEGERAILNFDCLILNEEQTEFLMVNF